MVTLPEQIILAIFFFVKMLSYSLAFLTFDTIDLNLNFLCKKVSNFQLSDILDPTNWAYRKNGTIMYWDILCATFI